MGAGGLDVALAMAGLPFRVARPRTLGVRLTGRLPDWVSAKDVILELLRRRGVDGCVRMIVEYHGPGLEHLTAMDRHVIANMGQETGATTSVFPSDARTRAFLEQQGRGEVWRELSADEGAAYDEVEEIDLAALVPLIAKPSSPGNVVPVEEVAGLPIGQAYIGSSANPGLRDFAVPAAMVAGRQVPYEVSLDINPSSRQILENLIHLGYLEQLVGAGARIHQAGCNGCIGMGQAPATDTISLRTVPRNFPGRSGTHEDKVYLCSPETAAASALTGVITDPRTLEMDYPRFTEPREIRINTQMLQAPADDGGAVELVKGPNIASLPELEPPPEELVGRVFLKVGDDVSTDEILPGGAQVLPLRSNLPAISRFVYRDVDPGFAERALASDEAVIIVGGRNYGQGSSREHAALAPRYLGLRLVIARSFARIHYQNLVNFGVLPVTLQNDDDLDEIAPGDTITVANVHGILASDREEISLLRTGDRQKESVAVPARLELDANARAIVRAGGRLNLARERLQQ
jgi:aconitate hydratase